MIEFDAPPDEFKLLRRVVRYSQKHRDPFPSLSNLTPKRSVNELTKIAKSWQRAGLGAVIEESANGVRSVSFSLENSAFAVVSATVGRTWIGRLSLVPRSDWIALAAFVVSVIALFKGK